MYSKAGRASSEAFFILQHGDEIINSKPKFWHGAQTLPGAVSGDKLSDMVAKKFGQNGVLKDLAGILDVDTNNQHGSSLTSPNKRKMEQKKVEPFSAMVSRDDREKVLSYKTVSSNAAYYQPKYHRVEKRNLILVDYSKSPTKRMFDEIIDAEQAKNAEYKSDLTLPPISPQKPMPKVKGSLPLSSQTGRPDILVEAQKKKVCKTDDLGGTELPAVLSSIPRLPRIKFSRTMSRKEIASVGPTSLYLSYSPNHEFVKKSLGLVGAKFETVVPRKDNTKDPYYTYESVYDYDKYVKENKSHVYSSVKSPVFEKMAPRERDPDSKYPGYLQTSMNSRLSEAVHSKSINNDSGYRSVKNLGNVGSADISLISNVLNSRT